MKLTSQHLFIGTLAIAVVVVIIAVSRGKPAVRSSQVSDESARVEQNRQFTPDASVERVYMEPTKADQEKQNPFSKLSGNFTWRKTLFNKIVIEGDISNLSQSTTYADIQARLEILDNTGTLIAVENVETPGALTPGSSVHIKLKSSDRYRHLEAVRVNIVSARPVNN